MHRIRNFIQSTYSGDHLIKLNEMRYLPRWVIFFLDIFWCFLALLLSHGIVGKLPLAAPDLLQPAVADAFILVVTAIMMILFKTFSGIIRHSTFQDLFKILLALASSTLLLLTANYAAYFIVKSKFFLTPLLAIYFLVAIAILFFFRILVKALFQFMMDYRSNSLRKRVLVVGIGDESVALARVLATNPASPYHLVGFITKRSDSRRAKLLGKKIFSQKILENKDKILETIDGLIFIKEIMESSELSEWTNLALANGLIVLKSPNFENFSEPAEGFTKIKKVQIEDLLNREPISIKNTEVRQRHYQKNILITGGAGSIGSEIVRQVALFSPSLVVVLDQAETPLNDIELELKEKFPAVNFRFVLGDISNSRRMEQLFEEFAFSMVYHAAAYKHVPIIEENPHEGVIVNIYGTRLLASLASKYKVNRFVMVSTDKAVNPTNVMGASKRAAELFVQALNDQPNNSTKFITTRFGNVLGSNGSVIPHFTRQIEKGGPVTITHPDIVRYFMTIPEACNLVLQAGTMGKGGEIFVFDMGDPVKIVDLAKRMIKLYGYTPDKEIKITYTGLRPGEKLYEELLSEGSRTMPTHHQKILISKDARMDYDTICSLITQITKAALRHDHMAVVTQLKGIVPEFISNNSVYEELDTAKKDV